MDDTPILVTHPDLIRKVYSVTPKLPESSRASRTAVQDLDNPTTLMTSPLTTNLADAILQAASRGYSSTKPLGTEEMRHQLEWSWGLEYGTLDEHFQLHFQNFSDAYFADVLLDDKFVVIPHSQIARKVYLVASKMPRPHAETPYAAQDLYQYEGNTFEYLVLPTDPSSNIAPRVHVTSMPPHLTISLSVDKLCRRGGYVPARSNPVNKALTRLATSSPAPGATFTLDNYTFVDLQYIHERWAICYVPPPFLGLPEYEPSVHAGSAASSTSGWIELEVNTPSDIDEPARRLRRDELKRPPVVKIPQLASAGDDEDSMSSDSHITGMEDPEEFAKASIARGGYERDQTWLISMESWAKGAERVDYEMLVNDGQIEVDLKEGPRSATSMDLTKPDYLSKPKLLSKRKIRT